MKQTKLNLSCSNCKAHFVRRHDRAHKTHNFCNIDCRKEWHASNVISERGRDCAICGKSFIPRSYQIKQGGGKYCSIDCSVENLHSLPRTKEWRTRISAAQKGRAGRAGPDNGGWKGGRYAASDGYIYRLIAPCVYMTEHRALMQEHLGRKLKHDEVVHHINENKSDNRIQNLQVLTRSEHAKIHGFGGCHE